MLYCALNSLLDIMLNVFITIKTFLIKYNKIQTSNLVLHNLAPLLLHSHCFLVVCFTLPGDFLSWMAPSHHLDSVSSIISSSFPDHLIELHALYLPSSRFLLSCCCFFSSQDTKIIRHFVVLTLVYFQFSSHHNVGSKSRRLTV